MKFNEWIRLQASKHVNMHRVSRIVKKIWFLYAAVREAASGNAALLINVTLSNEIYNEIDYNILICKRASD